MKVTTDACLFGAWAGAGVGSPEPEVRSRGNKTLLDIGTGTGLLSLMIAQKNPGLVIDAIEMDPGAAMQATENFDNSPWRENIRLIRADARNYPFEKKYDYIVSNPPFFENELKSHDAKKNIARHDEGLLLPELLRLTGQLLAPGGSFYFMLPYKRDKEVRELFTAGKFHTRELCFVRPSADQEYFRLLVNGSLDGETGATVVDELTIMESNGNYSRRFTGLLRDYYLYL